MRLKITLEAELPDCPKSESILKELVGDMGSMADCPLVAVDDEAKLCHLKIERLVPANSGASTKWQVELEKRP